jgi:hypothetical protein
MQSLVVVLAALGCLAGLGGTRAAQTCTQKFTGLQTCTLFNGQFATGDAASLEATRVIDGQLLAGYKNYTQVHKDAQCQTLYLLYGCINAINHPQFPAAAPCSSTGARLQMCKGLCVNYMLRCNRMDRHYNDIDKTCAEQSAPAGAECFGDAGVLGMASAAHAAPPPAFAVVFLALAAVAGGWIF